MNKKHWFLIGVISFIFSTYYSGFWVFLINIRSIIVHSDKTALMLSLPILRTLLYFILCYVILYFFVNKSGFLFAKDRNGNVGSNSNLEINRKHLNMKYGMITGIIFTIGIIIFFITSPNLNSTLLEVITLGFAGNDSAIGALFILPVCYFIIGFFIGGLIGRERTRS